MLERHEKHDTRLVAYIAKIDTEAELRNGEKDQDAATRQPCDQVSLQAALRQTLPDYMIPSAFVFLEAIPLTPNGKLDRRALPAPEYVDAEHEFVAPRTEMETAMAAIWQEVLDVDQVGVYDNFFALGGHSLLAARIISRVNSQLDRNIPLKSIFEVNNLSEFCLVVEAITNSKNLVSLEPTKGDNSPYQELI